jgi:hypothetical protein
MRAGALEGVVSGDSRFYVIAEQLTKAGRHQDAVQAWVVALLLDDCVAAKWSSLGESLLALGLRKEAYVAYREALDRCEARGLTPLNEGGIKGTVEALRAHWWDARGISGSGLLRSLEEAAPDDHGYRADLHIFVDVDPEIDEALAGGGLDWRMDAMQDAWLAGDENRLRETIKAHVNHSVAFTTKARGLARLAAWYEGHGDPDMAQRCLGWAEDLAPDLEEVQDVRSRFDRL